MDKYLKKWRESLNSIKCLAKSIHWYENRAKKKLKNDFEIVFFKLMDIAIFRNYGKCGKSNGH